MEIPPESLFSVTVCRLAPRSNVIETFVSAEEYKQYFSDANFEPFTIDPAYKDSWVSMPRAYQDVYLGEAATFYISCINDSIQDSMTDVAISIDLQVGKQVQSLKRHNISKLDPKNSVNEVVSFEVKSAIQHSLIITLLFNSPNSPEQVTTRKYFTYRVSKPIDVKTKSYVTEYDEIYLEALFQNQTRLPMSLTKFSLESSNFDVISSHNFMPQNDEKERRWIFGKINRLDPLESRQYLFILKRKPDAPKPVVVIGKLDIIWYSGLGVRGHIQTSQLEASHSSPEVIKIIIDDIPREIKFRQIFKIKFRIINNGSQSIHPVLHFVNNKQEKVLWLGLASIDVNRLEPDCSAEIEMKLYPTQRGLHNIPLIKVHDLFSQECYERKELAFVNIV